MAAGLIKTVRSVLLAGASLASLTAPTWVHAQQASPAADKPQQVEEVVVTARKRTEKLQEVPASISAVSASRLAASGINDIQGVVGSVPNVSFSGGIAGAIQGQVGIRGISTLVRNIGVESGVGFYVDGVYLGRPDSYNQELIDIDRVEVLRGPQGTLFGKNTIAGVFNITTKQPGDHPEAEIRAEVGNYDLARIQAYVMGPIADGVAAKLAMGYVHRDGTYKNLSGGQNGDQIDTASMRAQLFYTPTDKDKLILSFDGLRDRSHPAFFQVTDLAGATGKALIEETTPHTINNNRPDKLNRDNYGTSITYSHQFAAGELTSITAFRHSAYEAWLDDDQNQVDNLSADHWGDKTDFFSQEVRFSGAVGRKLSYIVGLYYADQLVTTDRILAIGNDLLGVPLGDPPLTTKGSVRTHSYAIFANADYKLTDRATLSVGLRGSQEDKKVAFDQADPTGIFASIGLPSLSYAASASNGDLSPTVSLSYKLAPAITVYGRIAEGFKSAAFNVDLVSSTKGLAAGPENATTYEVGVKSDLFERRLRANLGVFTTAYDNMQVSQLLGSGVTLNNAGKATISGVEAEFTAVPIEPLRLDASFGYLNAKYDKYKNCGVPTSLGGGYTDCSGKWIVGAPEFTARFGAEYDYPVSLGDIVLRADVTHESPVYFDATNSDRFRSDGHTLLDMRLGLRTDRWDIFLWSKNITNATYITYRDDRTSAGALQTTAYGDPRTFGATLTARF
ncbi:MAG: TonB-dependent receptor [Caulobacteraceae bacterium]|nr:TonB-dependent receptor [Caulobacteraceae bacterium]